MESRALIVRAGVSDKNQRAGSDAFNLGSMLGDAGQSTFIIASCNEVKRELA